MGAALLPIGMFTDVSAGALSGGGVALPLSAQGSAGGEFQNYLSANGGDTPVSAFAQGGVAAQGVAVAGVEPNGSQDGADGAIQRLFSAAFEGSIVARDGAGNGLVAELAAGVAGEVPEGAVLPWQSGEESAGLNAWPLTQVAEESDHLEEGANPSGDELLTGFGAGAADVPSVLPAGFGADLAPGAGSLSEAGDNAKPMPLQALAPSSAAASSGTPVPSIPGAAVPTAPDALLPVSGAGEGQASSGGAPTVGDAPLGEMALIEPKAQLGQPTEATQLQSQGLASVEAPGMPDLPATGVAGIASPKAQAVEAQPRRWQSGLPDIARAPAKVAGEAALAARQNGASSLAGLADASSPDLLSLSKVVNPADPKGSTQTTTETSLISVAGSPKKANGVGAGQEQSQVLAGALPLTGKVAGQGNVTVPDGIADDAAAADDMNDLILADGEQVSLSSPKTSTVTGGAAAAGAKPAGQPETPMIVANASIVASAAASAAGVSDEDPADGDLPLQFDPQTGARQAAGDSARMDALQVGARAQTQAAVAASQVASAMVQNLKNGQTRFQMRLDPPELGRVEVNMKVSSDGTVHAHLVVERSETLDLFMRDQRGLERALQSAGLNVEPENLQFSLSSDGGQQFSFAGDQRGDGESGGNGSMAGDAGQPDDEVGQVREIYLTQDTSGLDIRI